MGTMAEHLRLVGWLERLLGVRERLSKSNPPSHRAADPYHDVVERIRALRGLEAGWNSYRAGRIEDVAMRRAIRFIGELPNLHRPVPPPSVAPTPNGGVALHWEAGDREVDVIFLARGGEYSVARRKSDEILAEGLVDQVDLLKDVVGRHVVQR